MKEISGENYKVVYDENTGEYRFEGEFTMQQNDYRPIRDALYKSLEKDGMKVSLDLAGLKYVNSSGISMIMKYMLKAKEGKVSSIEVFGNASYSWQPKNLTVFTKIWEDISVRDKK